MKKYLLLALVAAAAASCQKDDIEIAEQDIVSDYPAECNLITFKAGQEGAESTLQKTAYDKPGTVVWQGNEHFAVFPDGESQGADFAASSQSTGKSSCTMTGSCKTASCYRAVYPYSESATFSDGKFNGVSIPSAQAVPGEGQFDPRADVMVAYTSSADMNFTFLHIGAKLGITVPNDGITAIEISCSANIAGKAEVSLGNEPAIESVSDASKTITLTCAQGKFTEGETYYACLLPTSQNETIKLKFIIGDNQYYEVLYRGSIGAMKRATRNMAAPPESAGHTLLRKSAVEAVIPMNRMIGRSVSELHFDYLKNVPSEIIDESFRKLQPIGSINVYSPEDNVFYFVSEDDIILDEDMSELFYNCQSLTKLVLNNFHTDYVTNMSYMFSQLGTYTDTKVDIDLSGFNTQNVTDMSFMFAGSSISLNSPTTYKNNIASIKWPENLSTAKVENMSGMFMGWQVTEIDLEKFNTASVTNMSQMFKGCTNLEQIAIPDKWNTKNVTNMSGMFQDCYILSDLDLANLNTANVTNMSNMFYGTGAKASEKFTLDLSRFSTSNVTDMSYMFAAMQTTQIFQSKIYYDSMLEEVDLSSFNTGNVQKFDNMFSGCNKLQKIYISDNFIIGGAATSANMYNACNAELTSKP